MKIKRLKTEDSLSQHNDVIVDIPVLYLQPGKRSPSPENFLEDPLSLSPSTSKKTSVSPLHYSFADSKEMKNFSIDDTILFRPEIPSQETVFPNALLFKTNNRRINILKKRKL
ncbi:uncharacterized protein [Halyomorpha halys]|uniref:uncharacterized protein n=1 Tax=Halyomorpha halys TaxID=286706 RepID=UPI0006D4DA26|nr:uncharacterized protein LOC106686050 [Halyomorpha halys]